MSMGDFALDSLKDIIQLFVKALQLFALSIEGWLHIPWPLVIGLFFPPAAFILSLIVWWLRGTAWPVVCGYPTTRGKPCRRRVYGEWRKCAQHRQAWSRRTDQHTVDPSLA